MAFLLGPAVRCHQLRVSGCVSLLNGTFLCKRDSFRSGERRFCTSLQTVLTLNHNKRATWCEASPLASVRHSRLIDSSRLAVDPPSQRLLLSPPLLRSPSLPLPPQSQRCAHRLDTANRDAARAQRSLKMAPPPPRVLWIYPSPLLLSLLLLTHAPWPCRALRNYPENEGGCCAAP